MMFKLASFRKATNAQFYIEGIEVPTADGAMLADYVISPYSGQVDLMVTVNVVSHLDALIASEVLTADEDFSVLVSAYCESTMSRFVAASFVPEDGRNQANILIPAGHAADQIRIEAILSSGLPGSRRWTVGTDYPLRRLGSSVVSVLLGGDSTDPEVSTETFRGIETDAFWKIVVRTHADISDYRWASHQNVLDIRVNSAMETLIADSPELKHMMKAQLIWKAANWVFALDPDDRSTVEDWLQLEGRPGVKASEVGTWLQIVSLCLNMLGLDASDASRSKWSNPMADYLAVAQSVAADGVDKNGSH